MGIAALGAIGLFGGFTTPVPFSTATAAAFGLALIGLRAWDERAMTVRWLAPVRACGRRCYSIYLVHLPVCTVGTLWLYERGITGFWLRVLFMIPIVAIAVGDPAGGPVAALIQSQRFHWLTAPRSTIIQTSAVHAGHSANPARAREELMAKLVR